MGIKKTTLNMLLFRVVADNSFHNQENISISLQVEKFFLYKQGNINLDFPDFTCNGK